VNAKRKGKHKAAQKKAKPAKPATRRVFYRPDSMLFPAALAGFPLIVLVSVLASYAVADFLYT
jgi:hypothetical protein